jgi:aspartate/tyrosine/aromatic aminotransferase
MRRLTLGLLFRNTFGKVPMAPPDPILGISVAYNSDPDTRKVNLGVGAYRDDSLKPVVFGVVRKVEEQVVAEKLNKVSTVVCRNTRQLRD